VKFVKRKTWVMGDWSERYWIRSAVEEAYQHHTGTELNHSRDMYFQTRELAEEFAFDALRRYHASGNFDTHGASTGTLNSTDRLRALEEISKFAKISRVGNDLYEKRPVGEPRFVLGEHGSPTLIQDVEVRIGGTVRTVKTVTVDGEEFSKTVEERVWSSWYPGFPVEESISVWSYETIEVEAGV
jgi:hypothetical protein